MNRLTKILLPAALAFLLGACSLANTSSKSGGTTPTPAPTAAFSNQTYASALRTASIRLQGTLPSATDLQNVLANGQSSYDSVIDTYLTTSGNPSLNSQMLAFYETVFMMGGTSTVCAGNCAAPDMITYNQDEVPALAVNVFTTNQPVTQLLAANYCVNPATFQPYAAGTIVDGSAADALGCPGDSVPANLRAGIISQKPEIWYYGTPSTINVRHMSVIHQWFNCNIYPDAADVPLDRTHDITPDSASALNANPQCAVFGCPDNGLGSGTAGTATVLAAAGISPAPTNTAAQTCAGYPAGTVATMHYPCNNNGNMNLPSGWYEDPSLGRYTDDPVNPTGGSTTVFRVSKKFQSKLAGTNGRPCHDCHGSLNARKTVYIPYDEFGRAFPIGTAVGDRNQISVESLAVNGGVDYCGNPVLQAANGFSPATTPFPVLDPNAGDCQNNGQPAVQYFGEQIQSGDLHSFGQALMKQPRFFSCMTTRHYNFILGKGDPGGLFGPQGQLGLQAAGGSPPPAMAANTLAKYNSIYEANGYNTRELLRAVLKGDEFLTANQ